MAVKCQPNKSGIIVFNEKYNVNRKEGNLKIDIGNKVLESKNSYKYLGEIITPNLKNATHLQAKEIQINGIIQSCVFASSNEVLAQIKMETLLKLYYSCVIPALLYGFETWILNSPEIKHLNRIQINTLRKILKLSTSTPIPITYSEIGEIPIQFRFYERQLLYLWKLVDKKDQANDVYRIQSHEYKTNRGSITSYYKRLLVTYGITTNENGL